MKCISQSKTFHKLEKSLRNENTQGHLFRRSPSLSVGICGISQMSLWVYIKWTVESEVGGWLWQGLRRSEVTCLSLRAGAKRWREQAARKWLKASRKEQLQLDKKQTTQRGQDCFLVVALLFSDTTKNHLLWKFRYKKLCGFHGPWY